MDQSKFKSLTEETSKEITRKMWELSTTKRIKQLKVSNMINNFSSFENLLKLKEVIPNTVIVFDFEYEKTKYEYPYWKFKMNSKVVTCVLKGREWIFEQIRNWDTGYIWCFSDIKPIENSNYAILKMNYIFWSNFVIKEKSWVDDWRKPYIDELKKNTETNNDLFIIADLNNLVLCFMLDEIEHYILIIKHFKHIIVWILSDLRNKKLIEKIHNLPKQYHYEVRALYEKDTKYGFLNLIDPRFENLLIKYLWYPYEIKIKRSNSTSNELVSKLSITTINRINRQMIKTDSEYFKKFFKNKDL